MAALVLLVFDTPVTSLHFQSGRLMSWTPHACPASAALWLRPCDQLETTAQHGATLAASCDLTRIMHANIACQLHFLTLFQHFTPGFQLRLTVSTSCVTFDLLDLQSAERFGCSSQEDLELSFS